MKAMKNGGGEDNYFDAYWLLLFTVAICTMFQFGNWISRVTHPTWKMICGLIFFIALVIRGVFSLYSQTGYYRQWPTQFNESRIQLWRKYENDVNNLVKNAPQVTFFANRSIGPWIRAGAQTEYELSSHNIYLCGRNWLFDCLPIVNRICNQEFDCVVTGWQTYHQELEAIIITRYEKIRAFEVPALFGRIYSIYVLSRRKIGHLPRCGPIDSLSRNW